MLKEKRKERAHRNAHSLPTMFSYNVNVLHLQARPLDTGFPRLVPMRVSSAPPGLDNRPEFRGGCEPHPEELMGQAIVALGRSGWDFVVRNLPFILFDITRLTILRGFHRRAPNRLLTALYTCYVIPPRPSAPYPFQKMRRWK